MKKILTLDIGATNVVLAEYDAGRTPLTLLNYGMAELAAPLDESNADTVLTSAIMEVSRAKGIKPGPVSVSVSGQIVFPRFAAIPYSGGDEKFEQMVRYEIEQNIPFPIDEMICDRQVLGDTENGDKAVMVVAAKTDQIEAITSAIAAAGFSPERVGVAPIAVTGALRTSLPGDESCKVILDIGAKTTSLVVVEGDRIYNRSIPVAGNTITKEIAQALGCTPAEAERLKREKGYVSLGGVAEDEDETADRISKACRAVLSRLHAEISRSINFYRSQQGGGAPTALYLTGGTALLPQIDSFFSENLQVGVEFFNPFTVVAAAPALDEQALTADASYLAASVGMALETAGESPYAIDLLPQSIINARKAKARIPFVAVGSVAVVLALAAMLVGVKHTTGVIEAQYEAIDQKSRVLTDLDRKIREKSAVAEQARVDADAFKQLLDSRGLALRKMLAVREALGNKLWIERWEQGRKPGVDKITIRGWSNRVAEYLEKSASKTVSEAVANVLRGKPGVEPGSVEITDITTLGKNANIEQFTVEVKFK